MRVRSRHRLTGATAVWLLGGIIVLGLVVSIVLALLYTGPEARAREQLAKAEAMVDERQWKAAAGLYVEVARSETQSAPGAITALAASMARQMQAKTTFNGVEAIRFVAEQNPPVPSDPVTPFLAGIATRAETDLAEALSLLWHLRDRFPSASDRIAPIRLKMLGEAVQRHPDVAVFAIELATLRDREGRTEEAVALLEPHRATVGDGDGARILGLADLARGDVDAALALLRPWLKAGVPRVGELEARYSKRYDELSDQELARLNDGKGPQALFDEWEAASKEDQPVIIDRHLDAVVLGHPDIIELRAQYEQASQVIPIAMDVGALLLDGALSMPPGLARRAALEQAESVFLSVRQVASDQVRVRSQLGQVYFWLGRRDDGRAEFEGLMADEKRAPRVLLEVSEVYRELGLGDDALGLAREAWDTGKDPAVRQRAARQVSLIVTDNDERIQWLERSDQSSPSVRATLAETRADKAIEEQDTDAARRYLEEAIAIHESLPLSDTNHNNAALAASSLLQIAPSEALRTRVREHIEKAVALSPSNAIILSNAADMLEAVALDQFIVERVGLAEIDWSAELGYLSSLWRTDAERTAVLAELDAYPGIATLDAALARVVLVRPEDGYYYRKAADYYALRRDGEALSRLARLYAQSGLAGPPDPSGARAYYLVRDAEEETRARERRYAGWRGGYADQIDGIAPPLTGAVLIEYLGAAQRAAQFGSEVDSAAVLAAARAGHAAADSALTRRALERARLLNAFVELRASGVLDARLAQCTACYRPPDLIALLAAEDSPLGQRVREHPDVRAASEALVHYLDNGGTAGRIGDWTLLSRLNPAAAARAREHLLASKFVDASLELDLLRFPGSVTAHTFRALLMALRGDPKPASTAHDTVNGWGLVLPVDLTALGGRAAG